MSTDLSDRLQSLLGTNVVAVKESDDLSPSIFKQPGHYVAEEQGGHRYGVFVNMQSWSFREAPYFYFYGQDPKHDIVVEPFPHGLTVIDIPKDYIASTYSEVSQTFREPAMLGGNAPRTIEHLGPNHMLLSTEVMTLQKSKNCLSAVQLIQSLEREIVYSANHIVNYARDKAHANEVIKKLCVLLNDTSAS